MPQILAQYHKMFKYQKTAMKCGNFPNQLLLVLLFYFFTRLLFNKNCMFIINFNKGLLMQMQQQSQVYGSISQVKKLFFLPSLGKMMQ